MLEVRDLERPLGGDLTPLDSVIAVAKSDCPNEWARYCDLAHQLVQPTKISQEEAARQLLPADGKHMAQTLASLEAMSSGYQQLASFGRSPKTQLQIMVVEIQKLEDLFRNRLRAGPPIGSIFSHRI